VQDLGGAEFDSLKVSFNSIRNDATVDHQFCGGHVAGRVRGEEENPVCNILRLPGPSEWYPGFGHFVRVDRRIAPGRYR
jgi:hypothetical protein